MGHKNKASLHDQIIAEYRSMQGFGRSKHEDKKLGIDKDYIYSFDTQKSYIKHAFHFADWVREQPAREGVGHKARTLAEARPFVEEFLQKSIDDGKSPYTIKLEAAALAKLYRCSTTDFDIETPSRSRIGITRSRGEAVRDKNFNEDRHADLVTFCRCTGLRRNELNKIRGTDLREIDGKYHLEITRGTKGGRPRTSQIIGTDEEISSVVAKLKSAGDKKVYPKVSTNADIHSYRSEYATRIYNENKRDLSSISHERLIIYKNRVVAAYTTLNHFKPDRERFSQYYSQIEKDKYGNPKMLPGYRDVYSIYACRRDLATIQYDRLALFAASNALGHNRECVVAEHYIR